MKSEGVVQQEIRLDAPRHRVTLWRNNSGAFKDDRGVLVRFGLGNDSAKINKELKSSDLIGITPVLITQEMVGYVLGVFTGVEVKPEGWTYHGTERERAQSNFITHVLDNGGFAGFATSTEQFRQIVRRK